MLAALFLLLLQAPDYTATGMKALEEQRYDAAVEAFNKQLAAEPTDYGAHFNLALAYSFLNRDTEAIASYKKVLELKPGIYQAELNLGILYLRNKQPAEAIPHLDAATQAKPAELRPRLYLADALLATGDNPKAAEHYKAASALDPKSAAAALGLARAQARQQRLDDAAPQFQRAAELDPTFRDALLELAGLYEKSGHPAEAIALYQQFPDNPAARERVGELMLETKKYADAIPQLEAAVAKDSTEANRVALSTAYILNKQPDKALPMLQKIIAANAQSFDLRMMYARALRDTRQFRPASEQFLEAVRIKPDNRQAWNDFAAALYLAGNLPQSLMAFEKIHQMGDSSAANYYFRAIIQDKLMDLKPALANYRQFLALSQGKSPDEEFKARQRARIIERELSKK